MKVREISCGKMHELAIALDKAGFDSDLIQGIISSKNNEMADAMYSAIVEKKIIVPVPTEKFSLLTDFGIVTVSDDYVHGKQLDSIDRKKLYSFDLNMTDENFSNPSYIMKPGDKFHVLAYKQIVSRFVTSEERIEFLAEQKSVLVGAQGLSLVYQQKRDLLLKNYAYCSFDKKEHLWKYEDNYMVPRLFHYTLNRWGFALGFFKGDWYYDNCLLCFLKVV